MIVDLEQDDTALTADMRDEALKSDGSRCPALFSLHFLLFFFITWRRGRSQGPA